MFDEVQPEVQPEAKAKRKYVRKRQKPTTAFLLEHYELYQPHELNQFGFAALAVAAKNASIVRLNEGVEIKNRIDAEARQFELDRKLGLYITVEEHQRQVTSLRQAVEAYLSPASIQRIVDSRGDQKQVERLFNSIRSRMARAIENIDA